MNNLQDDILAVFINKNSLELKDTDVSSELARIAVTCTPDEVCQQVRLLSPGLFELNSNPDRTTTIRVKPRIEICEDFHANNCRTVGQLCNKLHICRYFPNCMHAQCIFPHNFNRSYNLRIVTTHRCQNLNAKLLVQLLGLHKRSRGSSSQSGARLNQDDNSDRQVDVSFPPAKLERRIDMTRIQSRLRLDRDRIIVESKSNESENEYFRRATLVLQQINDVTKLLASPILTMFDRDIKFKRTKKLVDKTNFLLKISINNEQDKIPRSRLEFYIDTLIDGSLFDTIWDISTDNEQIVLVQCKSEIDFDGARQKHLDRPSVSGKDTTLAQIYEWDAVEIHSNQSITEDIIKRIFQPVWKDIFVYDFPRSNRCEVEFINTDAIKHWRSSIDSIQNEFQVTIIPLIDCVGINDNDTPSIDGEPVNLRSTTITLREDWALVAGHRTFKIEYKNFIHEAFGGTVEVDDDKATYFGDFPSHLQNSRDDIKFGNKTNEFMRIFQCETFENLNKKQIETLQANKSNVAYSRMKKNDYMVIAKSDEMSKLKQQLKASEPPPKSPVTPSSASTSMYSINTRNRISMFSIEVFERRLQRYLKETFRVELKCERLDGNDKTKGLKNNIRLKIIGESDVVEKAMDYIDHLFSVLSTMKFDKNWTKVEDAIHVINYQFKIYDMICICERISPTNVNVYYFDITNSQFGISEDRIEKIINDSLRLAIINLNQQSISVKLKKDLTSLEENVRKRNDYNETICLSNESNTIYLFGVPELIDEFQQKFEQLKGKNDLQPCRITLSEYQLNYLTYVAKADMKKLETECKSNGCDVNLKRLCKNGEFLAPVNMHSDIKDKLQKLAQISEISFDITEQGCESLVTTQFNQLVAMVQSKCYLDKKVDSRTINISIPKSRLPANQNGMKSPDGASASASASVNEVTSVNIGQSTLTVKIGDFTKEAVDAIVVCTSLAVLCNRIVDAAGADITTEVQAMRSSDSFPNITAGGKLSCKNIIFVPWDSAPRDPDIIRASLSSFVSTAFEYAKSNGCKSIAFPAIGCEQYNHNPLVIGKFMLNETRDQLKAAKIKMNISYVLLKSQPTVYDAFIKCLNEMEAVDIRIKPKVPPRKNVSAESVPFDRKTVKIILIGADEDDLLVCKERILDFARSCSAKIGTKREEMLDWPQDAIKKFYDYCLKQQVIPTLDLDKTILELEGSKDGVHECEKYYYKLTNEILGEQHNYTLSEGVIWSFELTPNSDRWEPYSPKLNGIIEGASSKKHPEVKFENGRGEKCQINFSKMEEQSSSKTRRVQRVLVDSALPKEWQFSSQNSMRVKVEPTSQEYQDVIGLFNDTMRDEYTQIIKIERIQNERWYKQYAAHRDDFRKRYSDPNERRLFHGCTSEAADQIIEKSFNRSFAGINGVVFGFGVYFHAHAHYSHRYAKQNSEGERKMFLSHVLIGKTCQGNSTMRVPPSGYDTTTDGGDIFVVYHDAGAYADHLITYK